MILIRLPHPEDAARLVEALRQRGEWLAHNLKGVQKMSGISREAVNHMRAELFNVQRLHKEVAKQVAEQK